MVAQTDKKAVFRMVLAHFGGHYMGEQLYGGYSECFMKQNDIESYVAIYMANDSNRGFWIRVYSRGNK